MCEIIKSFWYGPRLGRMERASIRSFLVLGYEFHLYAYEPPEDLPEGVVFRDASEILPREELFFYRHGYGKGSPSAFSNYFRYTLLLKHGGWWTDLDVILLKRLSFDADHVVGLEREPDGKTHIAAGLIRAPEGSPVMAYCVGFCRAVDRRKLRWGHIGPRLLAEALENLNVPFKAASPEEFYPIDYWNMEQLLEDTPLPPDAVAVHLWCSQWRHRGLDPDAGYDPNCLYERLMLKLGEYPKPKDSAAQGGSGRGFIGRFMDWAIPGRKTKVA